MRFPFPIREVIEQDGQGRVCARGVEWIESNAGRSAKAILFLLGSPFYGCSFLDEIFRLGVRVQSYHVVALLIAATTIVIAGWIIKRELSRRRRVIFCMDGTVKTPRGFCGNDNVVEVFEGQAEIASIETYKIAEGDWAVLAYMRDGETYMWTRHQDEFDARKIAVRLTNALRVIREASARASRGEDVWDVYAEADSHLSGERLGGRVHVVID